MIKIILGPCIAILPLPSAEAQASYAFRHHPAPLRYKVEGAVGYGIRIGPHMFWVSPDGSMSLVPTEKVEVCPGSDQVETLANEADCEGGPSGAPNQGG